MCCLPSLLLGAKYLAEKSKEEGVITLKSGMLVEIIKSGTDAAAKSPKVFPSLPRSNVLLIDKALLYSCSKNESVLSLYFPTALLIFLFPL